MRFVLILERPLSAFIQKDDNKEKDFVIDDSASGLSLIDYVAAPAVRAALS